MNRIRFTSLATMLFVIGSGIQPALASQSLTLGSLTITVSGVGAPSPNTFDGGAGSFSDPWQIGFATSTTGFEVTFAGDTVTNCVEASSYSGFSVDPFTSGDTNCSFQITSSVNQKLGVRVTFAGGNATSTIYFIKTGSLSAGSSGPGAAPVSPATPAKYSGPEFSGLSGKGIMTGSASRLEGKNLDEISSITIDGKPATFKLDGDKALDLTLPEGLAPGTYDLVINSSAGKLTHINAIRVREPLKSFSITSRSSGKISEEQYQEHALISAMQVPELNKARCVVNASSLAMAKAQAQRLCALVKAANPNIETTVVEARSTVKGDAVFARVSYGWTK